MRKVLKFFIGGGVVGLVMVLVYWILTGGILVEREVEAFPTPILFPTVTPPKERVVTPTIKLPQIQGGKFVISGVEVEDFLQNPVKIAANGDVLLLDNDKYQIVYDSGDRRFLISIVVAPFEEVRVEAEEEFLDQLGISEKEGCRLDVVVTTPYFANPDFAGKEYRLSFCE